VGLALCIFYILLLSISEHLGFTWSYLISALAVIGMVGLYAKTSCPEKQKAWLWVVMLLCYMATCISSFNYRIMPCSSAVWGSYYSVSNHVFHPEFRLVCHRSVIGKREVRRTGTGCLKVCEKRETESVRSKRQITLMRSIRYI